jgi:hypothetical protein
MKVRRGNGFILVVIVIAVVLSGGVLGVSCSSAEDVGEEPLRGKRWCLP